MKIVKYILGILAILFVLLLAAPFIFKGKIVSLIKEEANKQLNARLNFNEDISLSLIRSFPNLNISIQDLSISGINDFEGDTLFSAKNTALTLDIMSVIKGEQINIRSVLLDQPRIQAFILSDGRANWDIAKTDTTAAVPADTSVSKFHVKLKKLEVVNGYILYDDKEGNMFSELKGVNYTMEGDFTELLFTLKNKMDIESLTFGMDGMNYLSSVKATANADIDADMNNFKFVFKDNEFTLNQLAFGMNGTFAMPTDDMVMDITYSAKQNDFKNFLSLIPALYSNDFKDLQSKGKMAFDGFVKGTYNDKQMPAFGLNLGLEQGWFKYPALPAPVENVNMKLAIKNPDGNLDHTEIDLSKLHFDLQGDPFDAKLYAKNPLSDPYIDAFVKGVLNLDNIAKIVPMPKGTTLHGVIKSDITAKGKMSTVENGNYEDFNAGGNLSCMNIYYASPDLPKPFELSKTEMAFSPKLVTLKSFDAKISNSDIHLNGNLMNFFPYYFGKGVLKGTLNFSSNLMDANEYLTTDDAAAEKKAEPDTASMTVFEVPKDIDFTLNSNISKLLYTNMEINDFKGGIRVADQQITFQNLGLKTLGSDMKMNGFYETRNPKKPTVNIDFALNNLDIQKAFKTFNTVKKLAPAAENIFGSFSTTFKMVSTLNEHMQPDYNTLFAEGLLSVPSAEMKNVKAMEKIADVLKKPEYKMVGLYNTKIKYKVEKGRVYTQPFDVKVGPQKMTLSGSTGLDQTIDYTGTINIPRKDLGAADKAMSDALAKLNQGAGSNIKMNETLALGLKIGGTFSSPTVSTNLADIIKSDANSLKDQALEEAKRKKKELEDKAKAEFEKQKKDAMDKAKLEADKAKKEAEAKARAEAERLKKESESKIRSEADRIKKQAEEEAKKKLKGIFK